MQWKKKSKRRGEERGLTVGVLHGVGVGATFPSMPWRPGARATTMCWMDLVARGDEVRKRGSGRDRRRGEEERGPTLVAGDTPTTRWTKPYPRETVARGRWSTRAPDLGGARGRRRPSPPRGRVRVTSHERRQRRSRSGHGWDSDARRRWLPRRARRRGGSPGFMVWWTRREEGRRRE